MLAADFCHTVRSAHAFLSHESVTYDRSPEVSMTAFRAQGPDLQLTPLMDMDFAIIRSLVRRSCLISGSCSSPRAFARRFFQTPFHIGALALRYPSPPSGWGKTCTSKLSYNARHTSEPPAKPEAWFWEPLKGAGASATISGGTFNSNGPRMNRDQHGSGELLFPHHARPAANVIARAPWESAQGGAIGEESDKKRFPTGLG